MSDVILVDDSNFDSVVLESEVPVLVDFGASWCGPCKKQMPIVEKFASDVTALKIKVCSVDIEDAPRTASRFSIKSVPTLMMFSAGKSVGFQVGLTSYAEVSAFALSKVG
jgi:thioredoxin